MIYKIEKALKYILRIIQSKITKKQLAVVGTKFMVFPNLLLVGGKYISIGDNFYARAGLRLEAIDSYMEDRFSPCIRIGNNVSLGENCHIGAINSIEIGNDVLFGSKVLVIDHDHGDTSRESLQLPPKDRRLVSKGEIVIGDNVWIGDGAVIMSGVKIGHNSVIGANALVNKDVDSYSVVGGNPARVIRKY